MNEFNITAEKRKGAARDIRAEGKIPAEIYGKNFKNIHLALESNAFNRVYKEAGSSNLVDLEIGDQSSKVLIHSVQIHPLTGKIMHIDFLKIDMKQKIKTEIPLEFVGETHLVVEQEGSLITNKDSLQVECLPTDLIDHIKVNVAVLQEFDQNIKVSNIEVPAGITVLDDPEEVVALVQPPRSEEELAALEKEVVEDVEKVEVEEKGKEEEVTEGEEGAEGAEKPAEGEKEAEKPVEQTPTETEGRGKKEE